MFPPGFHQITLGSTGRSIPKPKTNTLVAVAKRRTRWGHAMVLAHGHLAGRLEALQVDSLHMSTVRVETLALSQESASGFRNSITSAELCIFQPRNPDRRPYCVWRYRDSTSGYHHVQFHKNWVGAAPNDVEQRAGQHPTIKQTWHTNQDTWKIHMTSLSTYAYIAHIIIYW